MLNIKFFSNYLKILQCIFVLIGLLTNRAEKRQEMARKELDG